MFEALLLRKAAVRDEQEAVCQECRAVAAGGSARGAFVAKERREAAVRCGRRRAAAAHQRTRVVCRVCGRQRHVIKPCLKKHVTCGGAI